MYIVHETYADVLCFLTVHEKRADKRESDVFIIHLPVDINIIDGPEHLFEFSF